MEDIVISEKVKNMVQSIQLTKYDKMNIFEKYSIREDKFIRMLFKVVYKNQTEGDIYVAIKEDSFSNEDLNKQLAKYIKKIKGE